MKIELLLNELEVFWAVSSPGNLQVCTLDRSVVPVVIAALKAAMARKVKNEIMNRPTDEGIEMTKIFELCRVTETEFAKLVNGKEVENGRVLSANEVEFIVSALKAAMARKVYSDPDVYPDRLPEEKEFAKLVDSNLCQNWDECPQKYNGCKRDLSLCLIAKELDK
jgi:hypothetical protein